jgi:hypothetical protein
MPTCTWTRARDSGGARGSDERYAVVAERVSRTRNVDDHRLRLARCVVKRRNAGAAVGNPKSRGGRFGDAPGVPQIRVEEFRGVRDAAAVDQRWYAVDLFVDDEVRLYVLARLGPQTNLDEPMSVVSARGRKNF